MRMIAPLWSQKHRAGHLSPLHHLAVVVDGGPGIVTFIVDGTMCDDSWKWVSSGMGIIPQQQVTIGRKDAASIVSSAAVYGEALSTSDVVALYRELLQD